MEVNVPSILSTEQIKKQTNSLAVSHHWRTYFQVCVRLFSIIKEIGYVGFQFDLEFIYVCSLRPLADT